jgi:hypothetical protein
MLSIALNAFLLSNDNNVFRERKSARASSTFENARRVALSIQGELYFCGMILLLSFHFIANARASAVALQLLSLKSAFPASSWHVSQIDFFSRLLQQYASKHGEQSHLVEQMNTKYYYYTRTQGLFRICYPKERPPTGNVKIVVQNLTFSQHLVKHLRLGSNRLHVQLSIVDHESISN